MPRVLFTALFVLALCTASSAAPLRPRPVSGCGIVVWEAKAALVVYAEPGVQRLAELSAERLPAVASGGGETVAALMGRKGGWLRVAYDDAGREGWVAARRTFRVLSWDEFLKGRTVRLLPGMKKGLYALHAGPEEGGRVVGTLVRDQSVRVEAVAGDWGRIAAPSGWFRWRDADGRLTVSFPPPFAGENR